MFANVMIPAFAAPYLAPAFLPWSIVLTLGSEWLVWWALNRRTPAFRVLLWVFGANVVSTLVGCFTSHLFVIPFGWEEGPRGVAVPSPEYGWFVYGAVIQACLLSIATEYVATVPFRRQLGIKRLEWCVVLGNVTSYAGLAVSLRYWPGLFRYFFEPGSA